MTIKDPEILIKRSSRRFNKGVPPNLQETNSTGNIQIITGEKKRHLFYEAGISLTPKPNRDNLGKEY